MFLVAADPVETFGNNHVEHVVAGIFEQAIDLVIAELGASKLKDIGRVMTELKIRYPGQMNFAEVRRRLCDQLN